MTHLRFWLIVLFGFAGLIWLLHGMLLPFILAMVVAYFLDPLVRRMEVLGAARWLSSLVVLLVFIAIITGLTIILAPLIRAQVADLIVALPGYVEQLRGELWPRLKDILEHAPIVNMGIDMDKLQSSFSSYTGDMVNFIGKVVGQVVSSGFAILDILAVLVLTPIVAFYLMRDWPKITAKVDSLLPKQHAPAIHRELRNVDRMIAGFIRGQAMVSLCLAVIYSVGLSLVGLKYGMVLGLITGIISFIPIVGTALGIIASLTLAFIQFDSFTGVLMVVLVFFIGQMLDGNFLTPKLVGDSVGLHPVWIMFAIMAGGKLLGVLGVVLAVPLAGTLAILLRLGLERYRASRYFS